MLKSLMITMKHVLYFIPFFLLTARLFAQAPAGPGQNGKAVMATPNNGHVYGKITDSTGKAVSDVSVILLQAKRDPATGKTKELLLKGTVTKAKGEFDFEDLPVAGMLKLKVTATGYKPLEQAVSFAPPGAGQKPAGPPQGAPAQGMPMPGGAGMSAEKDLGRIVLTSEAQELQGIVVIAPKSLVKLDIDKKVFNVEKNLVSEGGTAVDVMKNVPSVNVDIDGNVSLRNASPQIFVDGRPTTLTLEQIPANAIESVEVITNPSAKYDASGGGAGILNIVLKKNRKTGYNGNVRAGVNKYGATDAGVDFNVRQNKVNFSASINARQANGKGTSTINRTNTTETPVTALNQFNTDKNGGMMLFGRAGLDYFVTNKTTLSVSAMRMRGDMKPSSVLDIRTDSLYPAGTVASYSRRNTSGERIFNGQGLVAGIKHLFASEGEEWTADANYFTGKGSNSSFYTTDYYAAGEGSGILNSQMQKILSGGNDRNLILQTDYVKPFTPRIKLETGLRAAIRTVSNNNGNYSWDNSSKSYVLLPSAASNYSSNDQVYAAYASVTSSFKNFGYKIGLRAESSKYKGELTETKQTFSNRYPISLFPSLFLSQKLQNNQELQVSYTRRINRPNFFQLIPFVDSTDRLSIRMGNPALVPEFTQSFELNYLKQFPGNNTFLASAYYKKTNNLITSYLAQQQDAGGNQILVTTFVNANSSYSTGAEFTVQNTFTKWWNTSTDINIYNSKINTDNITATSQGALWSWFGKFNSNFKLPAGFNLQLSAMYQSKTNLPVNTNQGGPGGGGPPGMLAQSASQGYIKSFYSVDFAVKKSFLNNKVSATFSINDIFRSRIQDQYSYSTYFVQEYSRLRDPQMMRLTFAYSFGKIDASLFKRKSNGTGQSGSDMQQQ